MNLSERLERAWNRSESLLCVGLDPDLQKIPTHLRALSYPIFEFNRRIIEATASFACCYKPQIAFYAGERAEDQLEMTMQFIRKHCPETFLILDSKRGDIGNTAEMYAKEGYERFRADAITVNPYLGRDSLEPFLKNPERGAVILCRTSNPGAKDLQDLDVHGKPLYQVVAEKAANEWNANKNILLVVGATYPEEMSSIRKLVGDVPFLVPGIGAQGGDVKAVMEKGKTSNGKGLLISASRSILYAGSGHDFAVAAGKEAHRLRDEINQYR